MKQFLPGTATSDNNGSIDEVEMGKGSPVKDSIVFKVSHWLLFVTSAYLQKLEFLVFKFRSGRTRKVCVSWAVKNGGDLYWKVLWEREYNSSGVQPLYRSYCRVSVKCRAIRFHVINIAVQEYQLKCFNTIFPIYRTILSVHILQPLCTQKGS